MPSLGRLSKQVNNTGVLSIISSEEDGVIKLYSYCIDKIIFILSDR